MKNLIPLLERLGIIAKEAVIFLALTKIGPSPVSRIAWNTDITRTHIYNITENLKTKGLVNETEIRGVKQYAAIDYENLLAYVKRKEKEMNSLQSDLLKVASDFHALEMNNHQKTKVRFFESVEGIKSINTEIRTDLQKQKNPYEFHVIFSADKMESVLPGWIEENRHIYYEPLMNKYAIICDTPRMQEFLNQTKKHGQKMLQHRIWPAEHKEFPTDTLCWFNKIAYLDMAGHPSGVIIENSAIADTFRMWFHALWESLPIQSR